MIDNSIVDEIHRIRETILAEFSGDLSLLIAATQQRTQEAVRQGRSILLPPRSPATAQPEPRKAG